MRKIKKTKKKYFAHLKIFYGDNNGTHPTNKKHSNDTISAKNTSKFDKSYTKRKFSIGINTLK